MILKLLFWFLLIAVFYTFLGYPIILRLLVGLKRIFKKNEILPYNPGFKPDVCLFVTAYNEKDYITQKVENSFSLDYPPEKIQYLWVTDGSDDGTPELLSNYQKLEIHHQPERKGKMHAMNRGMQFVTAPFVIFSDTNTILSKESVNEIVKCFSNPKVGCVAGEKRIAEKKTDAAAGSGEGLYWKFESYIKKLDFELNTTVGAVGELFAIRTHLFEPVETDTLLDDFIISLRIAQKNYIIAYAPNAYATETASLNVKEEMKRKIRIAAGGMQTLVRLKSLLNPFKHGLLSWQYFSHKVMRWTIAPLSFFLLFPVNLLILFQSGNIEPTNFYLCFFICQLIGYLMVYIGWQMENRKLKFKKMFVPYYFFSINYASVLGIIRYFKGKQSVNWEKSKRG